MNLGNRLNHVICPACIYSGLFWPWTNCDEYSMHCASCTSSHDLEPFSFLHILLIIKSCQYRIFGWHDAGLHLHVCLGQFGVSSLLSDICFSPQNDYTNNLWILALELFIQSIWSPNYWYILNVILLFTQTTNQTLIDDGNYCMQNWIF